MQTIWNKGFEGKDNHHFTIEVTEVNSKEFSIRLTDTKLPDKLLLSEITFSREDIKQLQTWIVEAYLQIPMDNNNQSAKLDFKNKALIDKVFITLSEYLSMTSSQKILFESFKGMALTTDTTNKHFPDAEVIIYVADREVAHLNTEAVTNGAGEFMEALGYELKSEDEPVYGSWWKRIQFVLSKQVSAEELDSAISKGKKALELKHVELPTAEQTEKLATASKSIIESLEGFNEAVVRLGAILVLKRTVNGKPKLIVQQLSSELITILDKKPQLLKSPQTIYELITGDVQGEDDADDSTAMIGTAVIPEE